MNAQMILVISSPSSSTTGFFTLICAIGESLIGDADAIDRAPICLTSGMATASQPSSESTAPWQTHTVFNQVPPLEGLDVFSSNLPLVEATSREGAGWVLGRASTLGRLIGGAPQLEWGRLANENKPVLRTFDRHGHRIDEVEFHPAWHQLMSLGVEHELHSLPWTTDE